MLGVVWAGVQFMEKQMGEGRSPLKIPKNVYVYSIETAKYK